LRLKADDAKTHYNLGVAFVRENRLQEAIEHFREAIRLKPDYGEAYNNLGVCLGNQGAMKEALQAFEQALKIEGAAADAHYNIAVTLEKAGQLDQALPHFEKAVAIKPSHEAAVESLARLHLAARRVADAVKVLRSGSAHLPGSVRINNSLALILATAQEEANRDGRTALNLAEQLCQATNFEHPGLLATLAAAQAETGDVPKALQTAQRALQIADQAGHDKFKGLLTQQLDAYRQGRPYRDPKY